MALYPEIYFVFLEKLMKSYFILNNLKLVQLFTSNEINGEFLYLKPLIIEKIILCIYFVIDNNVSKPILIVCAQKS